jgi:predicted nucleic acid-binding protein
MIVCKTKDFESKNYSSVIIDTNVILYLFAAITQNDNDFAAKYAPVFSFITSNNVKIKITDIQISELVNTLVRREYRIYKKLHKKISYKDYRGTPHYMSTLRDINDIVIKKLLQISENDMHCLSIAEIDEHCNQNDIDYNDTYIISYAEKNNLPIITNDRDFFKSQKNVEIFTELI